MLNDKSMCKYETPYINPFETTQCLTNGIIILHMGTIKTIYNICQIKLHRSDKCFDYWIWKAMLTMFIHNEQLYTSEYLYICIYSKYSTQGI